MCGVGTREEGTKIIADARGGGKERDGKAVATKPTTRQVPPLAVRTLWEMGLPHADCILVAGAEHKEIRAHRCFLAAVSDRFKEMFFGAEALPMPASGPLRVNLPDADAVGLAECVRFVYMEDWSNDASAVVRCKRTASQFDVPGLEHACCEAVRHHFGPETILQAIAAAVHDSDKDLIAAAVEGASRDPRAFLDNPMFLDLPAEAVGALAAAQTFAVDEPTLVRACIEWADHQAMKKGKRRRADGAVSGAGVASAASSAAAVAAAAARAVAPKDGWAMPSCEGAALREELVSHVLMHLRLPLLSRDEIIRYMRSTGILAPGEFAALIAHTYKPRDVRLVVEEVHGFKNVMRDGTHRTLVIHMWGGGGASGQDTGPQYGGAGGYLCVSYKLTREDLLTVHVGDGGYADAAGSNDAISTLAWPNGGCGGYNWVSGGGGGATFVTSALRDGEVIAGSGGGGGSPANGSWSSGGGGGGGTRDGKVGVGGHGGNQARNEGLPGTMGGGNGGNGDSRGAAELGACIHGAGGGRGGSSRANGGQGGDCSHKWSEVVERINAKDHEAIKSPTLDKAFGAGGRPGSGRVRGEPGMCIIIVQETGEKFDFKFTGKAEVFDYGWGA